MINVFTSESIFNSASEAFGVRHNITRSFLNGNSPREIPGGVGKLQWQNIYAALNLPAFAWSCANCYSATSRDLFSERVVWPGLITRRQTRFRERHRRELLPQIRMTLAGGSTGTHARVLSVPAHEEYDRNLRGRSWPYNRRMLPL